MKIAAIMTCHNRRNKTIAAISKLHEAAEAAGIAPSVWITDDGSRDGTRDALLKLDLAVNVIDGDGSLYWGGGTYKAFQAALNARDDFDFFLLLNDDTDLYPGALVKLLDCYTAGRGRDKPRIVVGATVGVNSEDCSYGGLIRGRILKKMSFRRIGIKQFSVECDSMNGNCVLIDKASVAILGPNDPTFKHTLGDLDYGLRAKRSGIEILQSAGAVGVCERNSIPGSYLDTSLPLKRRVKLMAGVKGFPFPQWYIFCRRHGGGLWIYHLLMPYINFFWRHLTRNLRLNVQR
ncbi:glycosyltransferase [Cupriavidus sp. WKF15]|uniref:glycosyltransferase family 2 protein n=1 Tax=Cupriavidus sp. WKF15 TaxID=3032282 RepID=UPI0023E0DC2D|nr:glycosyltransferase [Cupriavidus sp. WKF15]WER47332.1 glycosyltransferase [Cupriavidus sp. WKF15]